MTEKLQSSGFIFSSRVAQCLTLAIGMAAVYGLRVNLSIAVVAMMDKNFANPDFPEYKWTETTKSLILSSFFWGYFLTPVLGGVLAQKFGGKIMLLIGVGLSSVATLLTPLSAQWGGWGLVCALRTFEGLVQACIFPSTHNILSKWAPVEERGILATIAYLNSQVGTVITLAVSGEIAASSWGWPGIFYLTGGVGILWCILYYIVGADSPATCKFISIAEREYIENSLATKEDMGMEEHRRNLKTPWRELATSVPLIVLAITHCCYNMGFWTLMTEIPSYLKNVLQMDVKSNGLLSALPYATMWTIGVAFSFLSILINKRQWMSISFTRKFFNTISFWVPAITLLALGFMTKEQTTLAVVLLALSVGFTGAVSFGFQINHMDLAPNFAGTLLGITQVPAHFVAILAPLIAGCIITDEKNPVQWRILFIISSLTFFFGNALFMWLGSTELQPWNEPKKLFAYLEAPLEDTIKKSQENIEVQEELQKLRNDDSHSK